ncbi:MAG: DNA-directed RNA polymerase subunit E'' [archaeon]|nr:MAG: DNA-directed RNA polymerase subunit E'' [archaeon]
MVREKVCTGCKRFIEGNICPACKNTKLTRNWQGSAVIIDPESEIAESLGVKAPGRYAISVSKS